MEKCKNAKMHQSFQYISLQNTAIIMPVFGIIFSLLFSEDPSIFVRPLSYSRISLKFIARLLVYIILGGIPLAAFMNPGWSHIDVDTAWLSVILWGCQSVGFFLTMVMLLLASPIVCSCLRLELHSEVDY